MCYTNVNHLSRHTPNHTTFELLFKWKFYPQILIQLTAVTTRFPAGVIVSGQLTADLPIKWRLHALFFCCKDHVTLILLLDILYENLKVHPIGALCETGFYFVSFSQQQGPQRAKFLAVVDTKKSHHETNLFHKSLSLCVTAVFLEAVLGWVSLNLLSELGQDKSQRTFSIPPVTILWLFQSLAVTSKPGFTSLLRFPSLLISSYHYFRLEPDHSSVYNVLLFCSIYKQIK